MFITQAYKGRYEFWRYILGTLITFFAWQIIGAIPLTIALIYKVYTSARFDSMEELIAYLESGELSSMNSIIEMMGTNLFLFFTIVSFAFGLFGVLFSAKILHKQTILELTTARLRVDWKRIFTAFFLVIFFNLLLFGISYYLSPEGLEWNLQWGPFIILLIICILFLPLQTSFEEYFFRGYLMQGIGVGVREGKWLPIFVTILAILPLVYIILIANFSLAWYLELGIILLLGIVLIPIFGAFRKHLFQRKWVPLLFTSIIFGIMHAANPEVEKLGYISMIYYIGTGLMLGVMTLMDDGMELALGFHAGNNILAALLVTTDWSALQTDAIFVDTSEPSSSLFEIIFPVFVVYPIMLLIFAKLYSWKRWKEKVFGIVPDKSEI